MSKLETKIRCYIAIGWALIIMFAFTGAFLNRVEAVFIAIVTAVMWTMIRIVHEGIAAVVLLRALKNNPESQLDNGASD